MQPVTEELRIDYVVSREEYVAAMRDATQHLMRSVQWGFTAYLLMAASVACGVAIGVGYGELVSGYVGYYWRWQWLILVAILAAWLIGIWQQRLRAARIFEAAARDGSIMVGPQALIISREGVRHEGNGAVTQVTWAAVRAIARDDYKYLFLLNNFSFFAVPLRAFADAAQREQWVAALREFAPTLVAMSPAHAHAVDQIAPTTFPQTPSLPQQVAAPLTIGLRKNLRAGARLAFSLRSHAVDFVFTAEAFAALALLNLGLLLAFGVIYNGTNGQFNFFELPRALLFVPLLLLFGMAAARAAGNHVSVLALPVALAAAGFFVSLVCAVPGLLVHKKIIQTSAKIWEVLFYVQIAWSLLVIAAALWRLAPMPAPRGAGLVVLGAALLLAPPFWLPQDHLWIAATNPQNAAAREAYNALANEKGFYAQHDALPRALSALQPERPGVADVYALTAGLYASEDVFMKETKLIDALLRQRFDADGRALLLINNPRTVRDTPVASATSLSAALRRIGEVMNREEDVLVLYVSSHGSEKHDLSVDFPPLSFKAIDPPTLKRALDESAIKWKVLVISACYSGGFIEPLKDENTLIITASSTTRTSFGCGHESDATYLAKALFDEELRKTYSFETAFANARQSIMRREREQGHQPSEPQIFVGAAMKEKWLQIEQRLSGRQP